MECKYRHTDRSGLYIMVFFIWINSCNNESALKKINRKLDMIQEIQLGFIPHTSPWKYELLESQK